MEPAEEPLRLYGEPSAAPALAWAWVETELTSAGTYWITAGDSPPHSRPVWGVWLAGYLHLSIGSPTIRHAIELQRTVSVHLDSALDVVIVEGGVVGPTTDPSAVERYERKYDWTYDIAEYGPLTCVAAHVVTAWRATGPAGRDGFSASGRWRFER